MDTILFHDVEVGEVFFTSTGDAYRKTDFLRALPLEEDAEEELFAENEVVEVYE